MDEDTNKITQQIAFDANVPLHENEITEAYRLGKYNAKEKRPRTITITLTSRSKRNLLQRNRMIIKTNPACSQIWINECLDDEQKRNRAEMRVVVALAISQGKEARAVAEKAGADPGGGGVLGVNPPPPPLWGTPKLHKEGKNVTRVRVNGLHFSI